MMYANKLAAAVKVNGKILRENGNSVLLPFQSEYSLLIKNLHSTRVAVTILIDGRDVMNGRKLIVNPGATSEIERFVDDLHAGRKFKFIERTEDIEAHRGIDISDGLIELRYKFESPIDYNSLYSRAIAKGAVCNSVQTFSANASVGASLNTAPGITAEGSHSSQEFTSTTLGVMETTQHTLVIQLLGQSQGEVIKKPITVKTKKSCASCGREYNSKYEYCPKDGTYLRVS